MASDTIPAGFYICDGGQYTNGVNPPAGEDVPLDEYVTKPAIKNLGLQGKTIQIPDLRSRFVIGYDDRDPSFNLLDDNGERVYRQQGGSSSITIDNLISHTHTGTTDSSGAHQHNSIINIKDENGTSTNLTLGDGNNSFWRRWLYVRYGR